MLKNFNWIRVNPICNGLVHSMSYQEINSIYVHRRQWYCHVDAVICISYRKYEIHGCLLLVLLVICISNRTDGMDNFCISDS
jgi:hypothetical protein